jgi:hypothetical protein
MAVQIARPRDMMMRDPMQGPMYQPNPTQQQKPAPSAAEQFGQMAQDRAMNSALNKGSTMVDEKIMQPAGEAFKGMFSSAAPTAEAAITADASLLAGGVPAELTTGALSGSAGAGTGAMATMGAAVPYVGAALLADEVLGLGLRESVLGFNQGGQVKPTYAAMGLGPLAMKKMKEEGMPMGMGLASMLSEGGTAGPLYASEGRKSVEGESIRDQLYPFIMEQYIEDREKIKDEIEQSKYKYGGGMAGPLSKVEYKSAGGETYKLSYGGPISKGA